MKTIDEIKRQINHLRNYENLSYGGMATLKRIENEVNKLIELPTDENIEKRARVIESLYIGEESAGIYHGFIKGAKWMREQLTK